MKVYQIIIVVLFWIIIIWFFSTLENNEPSSYDPDSDYDYCVDSPRGCF